MVFWTKIHSFHSTENLNPVLWDGLNVKHYRHVYSYTVEIGDNTGSVGDGKGNLR